MNNIQRAKKPTPLPLVFTREEVRAILIHLEGSEVDSRRLTLWRRTSPSGVLTPSSQRHRDFVYKQITIRYGKGAKDRITMLPASVEDPLQRNLTKVRALHELDLREGYGEVFLPNALARKYPNAAAEWAWQGVFPAAKRSVDPRSNAVQRHHIPESVIQKAVKAAIRKAAIAKPGSCNEEERGPACNFQLRTSPAPQGWPM